MSIKIFSFKGLNGVMNVLGILIPVVTWLVEKVRKNNSESALCVAGQELEKRSLEKSI